MTGLPTTHCFLFSWYHQLHFIGRICVLVKIHKMKYAPNTPPKMASMPLRLGCLWLKLMNIYFPLYIYTCSSVYRILSLEPCMTCVILYWWDEMTVDQLWNCQYLNFPCWMQFIPSMWIISYLFVIIVVLRYTFICNLL